MTLESLTQAIAALIAVLDDGQGKGIGPNQVPVHYPPADQRPIGTPAIILHPPQIIGYAGTVGGCTHYDMRVDVTVVAESTVGVDLAATVDAVCAQIDTHHLRVTSGVPDTWQPPDTPSPLPAYTLTVE